jgi:hypothetical protein
MVKVKALAAVAVAVAVVGISIGGGGGGGVVGTAVCWLRLSEGGLCACRGLGGVAHAHGDWDWAAGGFISLCAVVPDRGAACGRREVSDCSGFNY